MSGCEELQKFSLNSFILKISRVNSDTCKMIVKVDRDLGPVDALQILGLTLLIAYITTDKDTVQTWI